MSKFDRVKQWAAFSRNWHIYDAKWQNPFTSAKAITKVGVRLAKSENVPPTPVLQRKLPLYV